MRTYVITGAAHCIGPATARLLADQGHTVLGVDLHDVDITADITADLASPAGPLALVDVSPDAAAAKSTRSRG